jgi:hypothetical protein
LPIHSNLKIPFLKKQCRLLGGGTKNHFLITMVLKELVGSAIGIHRGDLEAFVTLDLKRASLSSRVC